MFICHFSSVFRTMHGPLLVNLERRQPSFPHSHHVRNTGPNQSARGWVLHKHFAPLFLPHVKSQWPSTKMLQLKTTHSQKKKKKGCSFSSIFPNPFSLSRIRSSQQKASPATGWWKDELSSCWLPSGIDLLLPACGTQYLKGVDGWMLKWIMYRLYEKWLGSSLFFFLNEELVFIYKLLYCQMPIKLNPAARMTRS